MVGLTRSVGLIAITDALWRGERRVKRAAFCVVIVLLATSAQGFQGKAYQMREDFGTEPLYDCYLSYSYYIPCPTSSWFWAMHNLGPGYVVGEYFDLGDPSMTLSACDPGYVRCDTAGVQTIEQFRVLDFAGYGTMYPGLYTVRFDIWCADENGCPVGYPLWTSEHEELCVAGWGYIQVTPPVDITSCRTEYPYGPPRILITAEHVGTNACYPNWGLDNISTPLNLGCAMHEIGCCPALYPRPTVSHYSTMHSGYYGVHLSICPPTWFPDFKDTINYSYGFVELAWRIYVKNSDPASGVPDGEVPSATWGKVKSMYR
jgi:hypothetical protein